MKKLDKAILVLFSIIILIAGVIINLLVVGWLDFNTIYGMVKTALTVSPTNQTVLIITVICILLAIKCLFWAPPTKSKEPRGGRDVLMQNDNGKLMISMATLENLVNTVVKQFANVQDIKTNIVVDCENNVAVFVNITVMKDVVIKELSLNIQNKIKETIKKTSDLDVKEVNVRIKNIASVPETENK